MLFEQCGESVENTECMIKEMLSTEAELYESDDRSRPFRTTISSTSTNHNFNSSSNTMHQKSQVLTGSKSFSDRNQNHKNSSDQGTIDFLASMFGDTVEKATIELIFQELDKNTYETIDRLYDMVTDADATPARSGIFTGQASESSLQPKQPHQTSATAFLLEMFEDSGISEDELNLAYNECGEDLHLTIAYIAASQTEMLRGIDSLQETGTKSRISFKTSQNSNGAQDELLSQLIHIFGDSVSIAEMLEAVDTSSRDSDSLASASRYILDHYSGATMENRIEQLWTLFPTISLGELCSRLSENDGNAELTANQLCHSPPKCRGKRNKWREAKPNTISVMLPDRGRRRDAFQDSKNRANGGDNHGTAEDLNKRMVACFHAASDAFNRGLGACASHYSHRGRVLRQQRNRARKREAEIIFANKNPGYTISPRLMQIDSMV